VDAQQRQRLEELLKLEEKAETFLADRSPVEQAAAAIAAADPNAAI
jgi:hypothetical protein